VTLNSSLNKVSYLFQEITIPGARFPPPLCVTNAGVLQVELSEVMKNAIEALRVKLAFASVIALIFPAFFSCFENLLGELLQDFFFR